VGYHADLPSASFFSALTCMEVPVVPISNIIHHDSLDIVNSLSDEMAGKFIKELHLLMTTGNIKTDDQVLRIALHPFVNQFKRDMEKYRLRVEKGRENGKKGGRPPKKPKKPSGLIKNPNNLNKPKQTYNKNKNKNKKETLFEEFWELYPNKQGKNHAWKTWRDLDFSNGLFDQIMSSLAQFKISTDWLKEDGKYIPMGGTWVHQRRWEDTPRVKGGSRWV